MMRAVFLLFFGICGLWTPHHANAADIVWDLPLHFVVIMPADIVDRSEEDPEAYEGVAFPLYCGIVSIYPKDKKIIFTKMTDLPLSRFQEALRPIIRDASVPLSHHKPVPVDNMDFTMAFYFWADSIGFKVGWASREPEIPVNVVPRFKRMCRYDSSKTPPTDCGYSKEDVHDLYIPFTEEEIEEIEKEHAR